MVKQLKLIITIVSFFLIGCKNENKYKSIEITLFRDKNVIKVITNNEVISSFEKVLKEAERIKLLKYSDDYDYSLKCISNSEIDYLAIKNQYVLSKTGLYKINSNFKTILEIKK